MAGFTSSEPATSFVPLHIYLQISYSRLSIDSRSVSPSAIPKPEQRVTTTTSTISQQQIDDYNANGFVIVEDVIPPDQLEELRRVTDEFVEQSRQVTEHTAQFDLEPGHTASNPKLRRLKTPEQQHDVYARMLRNDAILDVVMALIGKNIRTIGAKLNMKSPEGGSQVEWHTDWAFYPHTNDNLLEVGIPLDDMALENGALMAIPGSHDEPEWSHHENGVFVGAVSRDHFNIEDAMPFLMKAGDISLHHVRLLHGSAPNLSTRPRRLLLQGYAAVDAFPLKGIADWDAWNARILRGEPTSVPRMEALPVTFPQPEPSNVGSIYEIQRSMNKSHYEGGTAKFGDDS